jgi:hypothetical protein
VPANDRLSTDDSPDEPAPKDPRPPLLYCFGAHIGTAVAVPTVHNTVQPLCPSRVFTAIEPTTGFSLGIGHDPQPVISTSVAAQLIAAEVVLLTAVTVRKFREMPGLPCSPCAPTGTGCTCRPRIPLFALHPL